MGDLLGCGLFHDDVLAHDMSLNVRPSDECRRRLSGRRDSELLYMGQRTGRCRFELLNAVLFALRTGTARRRQARRPAESPLESGILKFLSSKCNAVCVSLSFESLSVFIVRHGKGPFLHQLLRLHCRCAACDDCHRSV